MQFCLLTLLTVWWRYIDSGKPLLEAYWVCIYKLSMEIDCLKCRLKILLLDGCPQNQFTPSTYNWNLQLLHWILNFKEMMRFCLLTLAYCIVKVYLTLEIHCCQEVFWCSRYSVSWIPDTDRVNIASMGFHCLKSRNRNTLTAWISIESIYTNLL